MGFRKVSSRIQLFLICLFATVLSVYIIRGLEQALPGNLDLLGCTKAFIARDLELASCFRGKASDSQKEVISFLRTRDTWENRYYDVLASRCGSELCTCLPQMFSRASLYDRIQAYYYAVSYRIQTGEFPKLDDCVNRFVSSNFLWHQARTTPEWDLADIISELAYLVDRGWVEAWHRGRIAFKQAERYQKAGNLNAAERAFEIALQSHLDSSEEKSLAYATRSMQALGELALARGEVETSLIRFQGSIALSPENAYKSFERLVHVWGLKKYSTKFMLDEFKRMRREMGENNPTLTSSPAQALLRIGATDAAWSMITTAPSSVQSAAPVLAVQGALYEKAGSLERARQYYAEALVQTLDVAPLEAASYATALARLAESRGDLTDAIANMELTVKLNPRAAWSWYALCQLYKRRGDTHLARQSLEKALSLDPKNVTFLKMFGELDK